jgi:hypothetical protein
MWGDLTIYPLVCDRTACTRYPFAPPTPSPINISFKCDGVQYLNLHVQAKGNNYEICQDHVDSTVMEEVICKT